MEHYYIVKISVPKSTGSCTINGSPGYGSPLSCADQLQAGTLSVTYEDLKFTDYSGNLFEADIFKQVVDVSITTPKLRPGGGVASRTTASVVFKDFTGHDPNPESPALLADPTIADRGSYFAKLDDRYILQNLDVEIELYETDGYTHTLKTNYKLIAEDYKYKGNDEYVLTATDILAKLNNDESQFPKEYNESLVSSITAASTQVTITRTNSDLTSGDWINTGAEENGVLIIGDDVLIATGLAGITDDSYTFDVTRPSGSFQIGAGVWSRDFTNTPQAHEAGDGVFLGKLFDECNLGYIIRSIFTASGIDSSYYNIFTIINTLDDWIPNNLFNAIYYEPETAVDVLNRICQLVEVNIFTDLTTGQIQVTATDPWQNVTDTLTEGIEFDYGTLKRQRDKKGRFSRAAFRYDKRGITEDSEKTSYKKIAAAINSFYEDPLLFNGEKTKQLDDVLLLGNSNKDYETAQTAVIRFVNRYGGRVTNYSLELSQDQLDSISARLSDVVTLNADKIQNYAGDQQSVNAQITQIKPIYNRAAHYQMLLTTYNPYSGSVGDEPITVSATQDINLFVLAGGPTSAVTRTFIFDTTAIGQGEFPQSIITGSFVTGSIINIVLLGSTPLDARGGTGGTGGDSIKGIISQGQPGGAGGTVLKVSETHSHTINIYLTGTRTVQSVSYSCNGAIRAPGGGASGFDGSAGAAGDGGGSGKGSPNGIPGTQGVAVNALDGVPGTEGATNYGLAGANNDGNGGGAAGKAIEFGGSATVNVYGASIGANYIQGNGNTPNFIA
jgi:hypothetical protein